MHLKLSFDFVIFYDCRLNVKSDDFCLKYYNQNDIPRVLQVLYASEQHRPVYNGICMAMLEYWNISENFLPLCVSKLPPMIEEEHKAVSSVKADYSLTFGNGICSDNLVPSLDASQYGVFGLAL